MTMKVSYAQIMQAGPVLMKMVDIPTTATVSLRFAELAECLNPHLIAIEDYKKALTEKILSDEDITDQNAEFSNEFFKYLNSTTAELKFKPIPVEIIKDDLKFSMRDITSIRFAVESNW